MPNLQNASMVVHVFGFLAIAVVLWVLGPHASASDVFLNFENHGGWGSMGVALMIGQVTPVGALGCECPLSYHLYTADTSQALMPQRT